MYVFIYLSLYRAHIKSHFLYCINGFVLNFFQVAKCGDGIVDRDTGEQCDDANDDIHDDCLGLFINSHITTSIITTITFTTVISTIAVITTITTASVAIVDNAITEIDLKSSFCTWTRFVWS